MMDILKLKAQGLTHAEIGNKLGISTGSARWRYRKAQLTVDGLGQIAQDTIDTTATTEILETNNIVVVSDLHSGCQLGLINADVKTTYDNGGEYKPSDFQIFMWQLWQEFWDHWVPNVTDGEPYVVVFNGDCIDGEHHGTTSTISRNFVDQRRIAQAVIATVTERSDCKAVYVIRGTTVHDGEAGQECETLAENVDAIPDELGNYSRYELWKAFGPCGDTRLAHIMHHIGTTGSQAYETSAVQKELVEAFTESGRWGNRAPDFVIRSHRHRYISTDVATERGTAASVVTPGWQGKTPFLYRIAGGRQSVPQFGGIVLRYHKGEFYVRRKVWTAPRPEIV